MLPLQGPRAALAQVETLIPGFPGADFGRKPPQIRYGSPIAGEFCPDDVQYRLIRQAHRSSTGMLRPNPVVVARIQSPILIVLYFAKQGQGPFTHGFRHGPPPVAIFPLRNTAGAEKPE